MAVEEKQLKDIPLEPGVYLFKDKNGKIIYVGKSATLRARVRSYFRESTTFYNAAKRKMVDEIRGVEIIETNSEIEALVKEAELIKRLKPKFNRLMRDSKNYLFVAVTKEEWPRIYTTHQPQGDAEPAQYIGPFTDAKALKRTLRLLRRIFPYLISTRTRRLDVQLGLAPDKEKIRKTSYRRNIASIRRVLTGNSQVVLKDLEKKIKEAAKKERFEEAALLTRQHDNLQKVIDHAHVLTEEKVFVPSIFKDIEPNFRLLGLKEDPSRIEAYDISNIHGKQAVGSMVVFTRDREGRYGPDKDAYRKFKIKTVQGSNDVAMMREVLERRFRRKEEGEESWPEPGLIVIDGGRTQLGAALGALTKQRVDHIPVIALAKKKEEIYFPERVSPVRAQNLGNAMLNLLTALRDETHRFALSYHRHLHRKETFE